MPHTVTLFETKTFEEVMKWEVEEVKVRALEWAVIQYVWCPYTKQRLGHRQHRMRHNQQWEGDRLKAKEKDLRKTNPASILLLDFQPPELLDNIFLLFNPLSLVFGYGSFEHWEFFLHITEIHFSQ